MIVFPLGNRCAPEIASAYIDVGTAAAYVQVRLLGPKAEPAVTE